MQFLTKIQLGRITNLSDARYAAAAGFDAISFCFIQGHERFISPVQAKQIIGWVEGITCIGEFGHEPAAEMNEVVQLIGLHQVQVPADYPLHELTAITVPVVLACAEVPAGDLPTNVSAILVDANNEAAWQQMMAAPHAGHVIVNPLFGNNAEIETLVKETRPAAIRLQGGDEPQPGMRDFDSLNELTELLMASD